MPVDRNTFKLSVAIQTTHDRPTAYLGPAPQCIARRFLYTAWLTNLLDGILEYQAQSLLSLLGEQKTENNINVSSNRFGECQFDSTFARHVLNDSKLVNIQEMRHSHTQSYPGARLLVRVSPKHNL